MCSAVEPSCQRLPLLQLCVCGVVFLHSAASDPRVRVQVELLLEFKSQLEQEIADRPQRQLSLKDAEL